MEEQLSNLALRHLIQENQFLENGFINKSQTTQDNQLKLKVHTKQGDKTVIVNEKGFFVSNNIVEAKQNPGGFSAFLKKFLFNQRIVSIKQRGFDRIVIFEFPESFLILEFFAKGNIVLCDKEMKILKAMRKEKWKDRELKKNEQYKFPSSQGKSIEEMNEKEFIEKIESNNKTSFGAVVEILNISPKIAEFVFKKATIQKTTNAKELKIEEIKKIFKQIRAIYLSKETSVFVNNKVVYSVEIGLEKEQSFSSVNKAMEELNKKTNENKEIIKKSDKKEKNKIDFEEEIKKLLQEEKDSKENGEFIYLKYQELTKLTNEIKKLQKKGLKAKEIEKYFSKSGIKKLDLEKNKIKIII